MDKWDRLEAIEDIKKLKARYFRCVDTKDPEGFANVFTPDGVLDLRFIYDVPNLDRAAAEKGQPPPSVITGREAILAGARKGFARSITAHHGHTPEIDIESPTSARGIWAMEDNIWNHPDQPPFRLQGYGHYHEIYERIETGWAIKYCKLTRLYLSHS